MLATVAGKLMFTESSILLKKRQPFFQTHVLTIFSSTFISLSQFLTFQVEQFNHALP